MTVRIFTPPTVDEGPAANDRLFGRYKITRADSVLMTGGVTTQQRTFTVQETLDADHAYIGGHEYVLSDSEYTQLVAAGYGAYITSS